MKLVLTVSRDSQGVIYRIWDLNSRRTVLEHEVKSALDTKASQKVTKQRLPSH